MLVLYEDKKKNKNEWKLRHHSFKMPVSDFQFEELLQFFYGLLYGSFHSFQTHQNEELSNEQKVKHRILHLLWGNPLISASQVPAWPSKGTKYQSSEKGEWKQKKIPAEALKNWTQTAASFLKGTRTALRYPSKMCPRRCWQGTSLWHTGPYNEISVISQQALTLRLGETANTH